MPSPRQPVAFVPHGGGPWPWVDFGLPKSELDGLSSYLRALKNVPKTPPKALVVVSAHWEASVPTVMSAAHPPMFYDYYGFPEASYRLTWPAPGDPALAKRVRELLSGAGFETAEDTHRGYDHGTFVPLKLTWPDAEVPVVQLSLIEGLDPREHLKMGRALAPLRDEGVFILGSGNTFHNMRGFRDPSAREGAAQFDTWLQQAVTASPEERDAQLAAWEQAPYARFSHPREEHLLPLMFVAGAAGADRGTVSWSGTFMGVAGSGFNFG
jgi:aromatic ring-opening dioxygenase catalytic subunit (LigB family)